MKRSVLVQFRGSDEFKRAMDELQTACGASDRSGLLEHALRLLAREHGVELPVRALAWGSNRYGPPGQKAQGQPRTPARARSKTASEPAHRSR